MSDSHENATPADAPASKAARRNTAIVVGVALLLAVMALVAISQTGRHTALGPTSTTSTTTTTPKLTGFTAVVATETARAGYASPGGAQVTTVEPKWRGAPLVMPVVGTSPGYYQVRLPGRPNGSTTWIKAGGLLVSQTPYRIVINLSTTHLKLLRYGHVVLDVPVGVGTSQYPTPTGNFFVAFYATSPEYAYGPWIMVTSAHSNTITDWMGTGDAMVAIHGPLGADRIIGTTGAHVSHGCIRMHRADQEKLKNIPIGTPVTIVP